MLPQELATTLRRLRLSGMLDTVALRQQEAEAEQLDYSEFLARLCEDEVQRRANRALARRVATARFPRITPLSTFDFTYNPGIPAARIRDLAACHWIGRHQSVCFTGPVGVGKSHLAQAIGYAACQHEYHVAYRKASQLFQDLSGGHADGTFERRLRSYLTCDLLIVDDFGLRELSAPVADDFFELVCQRDQQGSWLVVSNREPADWYGLFPNPIIAEGVLDRLVNSSYHIVLEGKSYRPRHRPQDPSQAPSVERTPDPEAPTH